MRLCARLFGLLGAAGASLPEWAWTEKPPRTSPKCGTRVRLGARFWGRANLAACGSPVCIPKAAALAGGFDSAVALFGRYFAKYGAGR